MGVIVSILTTEMCERLSYYSIVVNLILFCTSVLNYSSTDAVTISLVFSGTTYLTPIIGGYLADAHIGRFNTIYGSALIYLIGLFLFPCSILDFQHLLYDDRFTVSLEWRRAFFLAGLALVSVGTGGIKANVGPFGAFQVQSVGPQVVRTFVSWYYWFVNAGAFVAFVVTATVQQCLSFAWGYLIPLLSMVLAILIFLLPRQNYCYRKVEGSRLVDSFTVCWQGCRKSAGEAPSSKQFLDSARKMYGGSFSNDTVDGVAAIVRALPILLCVVVYCTVYFQMQSTFFLQGERMNLHGSSVQVPVATLNAFSIVALVFLMPFLDKVVYPCFQRGGHPLSHLHRIGIGFLLAALSMLAAALVEMYRKQHLGFLQTVGNETFFASNVTVFLQVPQYALVGCSEAFTTISGLELAYTQTPDSLQGLMTGLLLATAGLGSYLAAAILRIVQRSSAQDPWFPDEINDGHVEYLFFLLAGLTGLFFLSYLLAAAAFNKHAPVEKGLFSEGKEQSDDDKGIGSEGAISQEIRVNQNDISTVAL